MSMIARMDDFMQYFTADTVLGPGAERGFELPPAVKDGGVMTVYDLTRQLSAEHSDTRREADAAL